MVRANACTCNVEMQTRWSVRGRFLGIMGQNPSVSKFQPHTCCCYLSLSLYRFEVCSIDSSKMIGNFHEVMNLLFFSKHSLGLGFTKTTPHSSNECDPENHTCVIFALQATLVWFFNVDDHIPRSHGICNNSSRCRKCHRDDIYSYGIEKHRGISILRC